MTRVHLELKFQIMPLYKNNSIPDNKNSCEFDGLDFLLLFGDFGLLPFFVVEEIKFYDFVG